MTNYTAFKKEVEDRFVQYMPEEMKGMKVEFLQVNKINRTLDGIRISCEKMEFAPSIYINDLYEGYRKCGDFGAVMSMAIAYLQQAIQADVNTSFDMETVKDNIIFQVVNTEQNRKILSEVPSRPFLDLSVIYRWVVQIDENGNESALVNNHLAEALGVTEEELFRIAKENTSRILPPAVMDIDGAVPTLITPDTAGMMARKDQRNILWAITNEKWFFGAASILYEDKLHAIAEQLESDLYIIPSSVNEMLATPIGIDPYELAVMLADINEKEVPLEERLSNQVYRYDRVLRKFSLATDTPNKKLGR